MRRKKILILPSLKSRNGDLIKKWFVELSQRNPKTDIMERRRIELFENVNINSFTTAAERYAFAEKIINELKSKLNNGWTIFNDTEAFVYENQTMYSNFARVYKRTVESNMTVNFWISKYISEELKQSGLSKNTVETYISCCRVFNMWIDANRYSRLDITAINNPHIIEFFTYLGENNF